MYKRVSCVKQVIEIILYDRNLTYKVPQEEHFNIEKVLLFKSLY